MSLRKNLTVVPSDTPEPNQLHESVSLFNEDGSPFSGGGPKVVVSYLDDLFSAVPFVESDVPVGGQDFYGVDFRPENWISEIFLSPDHTFWFEGDNHASWGSPRVGEFIIGTKPGKTYQVYANAFFQAQDFTNGDFTGKLKTRVSVWTMPDNEDGWNAPNGGIYTSDETLISANEAEGVDFVANPWKISDFMSARAKKNGERSHEVSYTFHNGYSVGMDIGITMQAQYDTGWRDTFLALNGLNVLEFRSVQLTVLEF